MRPDSANDNVIDLYLRLNAQRSEAEAQLRRKGDDNLHGGGDGGTSGGVEERVTRLETHFEYVRKDLDAISAKLDRLDELPTKADLRSWQWQWIATGVGIIALTIGGITGGLALIARFAG